MGFPWLRPNTTAALSSDEATELATRVAELTKAGLPLGAGLRAMAEELPGRHLACVLTGVADRLDAGVDLVPALDSLGGGVARSSPRTDVGRHPLGPIGRGA